MNVKFPALDPNDRADGNSENAGMRRRKQAHPEIGHPAVQALLRFFDEMNRWEQEMIAKSFRSISDFKRRGKTQLRRLARIYEQFCEPGGAPERLTDINWGDDSPDYDPDSEHIQRVKCGPSKVLIETQMTRKYGFRMRYELVYVGKEWRLRSSRKCFDPDARKWCFCEL